MVLKKPAIAGSLESSDVQIRIRPNPDGGIVVNLDSVVKTTFGDAILKTVYQVLGEFEIFDAELDVFDKGALDRVIRSRMQTAICRAAEEKYDWSKEDRHDA